MNEIAQYAEEYLNNIYWKDLIGEYRTRPFYDISNEDVQEMILFILKELEKPLEKTGEHRKTKWEHGWNESLEQNDFVPGYFNKYPVMRFNQKFIRSNSIDGKLEYHLFCAIQEYLFAKYLKDFSAIYEFGCGTGHNLFRMRNANKEALLCGLDWTTSGVRNVEKVGKLLKNVKGVVFDMFEPNFNYKLAENSAVVTVASMEQLGDDFHLFLSYLIDQKPSLVLHIEPFQNLLDPDNLLDYLSIQYMKKRNYINGYIECLEGLGKDKVEIIDLERSYVGSLFIDGYTILAWRPV
jgi:hypothetical protein